MEDPLDIAVEDIDTPAVTAESSTLPDTFTGMMLQLDYNNNILFEYASASLPPALSFQIPVFDYVAMAAMPSFSSILDPGCTNHIIKEQHYFWNYSTTDTVNFCTANCEVMTTKGCRDICTGNHTILRTLCNCLHSSAVPDNLFSVAFQDMGVTVTFSGALPSVY